MKAYGGTNDIGEVEGRYEYDAFGKPYDGATGLYDYGYRDYAPDAPNPQNTSKRKTKPATAGAA